MLNRIVGHLEEGLLAFLLAAMTAVTFVQVVMRYVFNAGFIWALEVTVYLFAWMIMIGISYGIRVHAHIGVDVLVKALPHAARKIAGMVAVGLSLLYSVLMTIGAYRYVERMHRLGVEAEDIPVERWVLMIILPIGFALLAVRLLEQAWAIYSGKAAGFELADEAADVLKEQHKLVSTEQRP